MYLKIKSTIKPQFLELVLTISDVDGKVVYHAIMDTDEYGGAVELCYAAAMQIQKRYVHIGGKRAIINGDVTKTMWVAESNYELVMRLMNRFVFNNLYFTGGI